MNAPSMRDPRADVAGQLADGCRASADAGQPGSLRELGNITLFEYWVSAS
jgi:hypothetical protein